jgi:hypothetical protein
LIGKAITEGGEASLHLTNWYVLSPFIGWVETGEHVFDEHYEVLRFRLHRNDFHKDEHFDPDALTFEPKWHDQFRFP